jgi:Secretion system C-terminal sorting domain
MKNARSSSKFLLAALAAATVLVSLANAEIPAGYKGLPFPPGSAPRELQGRINFNEYDLGGKNVAWYQDDDYGGAPNRKNIDIAGPAFYCTNDNVVDRDTFYAAGIVWPNGVRYPNPVDTMVQDCYIGASHANTWVKWTVHVTKPGKYWISSFWAADAYPIMFHINFLNGSKTISTPTDTIKGSGSYHAWRKYSDFTSVQLDSGVQVMHFVNESYHLNQDFLYFATDSGQFQTGISRSSPKATNTGACDLSINRETVRFSLPDAGKTKISVFDCLGREIMPVLNKTLSAGSHSAPLNTASLRKGIYFVRMEHNNTLFVARFQHTR